MNFWRGLSVTLLVIMIGFGWKEDQNWSKARAEKAELKKEVEELRQHPNLYTAIRQMKFFKGDDQLQMRVGRNLGTMDFGVAQLRDKDGHVVADISLPIPYVIDHPKEIDLNPNKR